MHQIVIMFIALIPPSYQDKQFELLQEKWIFQQTPLALIRADRYIRADERELLERLACDHYICTKHAAQELLHHPRGHIICFWGRHYRNYNVRFVCNELFIRYFRCQRCGGDGIEYAAEDTTGFGKGIIIECNECFGSGNYQFRILSDGQLKIRKFFFNIKDEESSIPTMDKSPFDE